MPLLLEKHAIHEIYTEWFHLGVGHNDSIHPNYWVIELLNGRFALEHTIRKNRLRTIREFLRIPTAQPMVVTQSFSSRSLSF